MCCVSLSSWCCYLILIISCVLLALFDCRPHPGRSHMAARPRPCGHMTAGDLGNPKSGEGAAGVNLYIKNLDESTDDGSLRALFETFGTITSVSAVKDDGGKCKAGSY